MIIFTVFDNEIFNICKISFNKRYLLHTYMLLCTIATTQKRNELTLGSSLDRVDLQLYRKRGK